MTIAQANLAHFIRKIDAILASPAYPARQHDFSLAWGTALTAMEVCRDYAGLTRKECNSTLIACFPALTTRFHS